MVVHVLIRIVHFYLLFDPVAMSPVTMDYQKVENVKRINKLNYCLEDNLWVLNRK